MSEEKNNSIENRFEMVLLAINRAKSLMAGAQSEINAPEKTKKTIIALKEIEKGLLDTEQLKLNLEKELKNDVLYKRMGDIDFDAENEDSKDISGEFDIDDDSLDDDIVDDIEEEEDEITLDDTIPLDEDGDDKDY